MFHGLHLIRLLDLIRMPAASLVICLALGGCPTLDSFSGDFEGTVVGSQCSTGPNCTFIRRGFPQGTVLSITDFQAPPTDAPGLLTTAPYDAFSGTPLETIAPLEHDQLSQLEFPGTDRLRNYIFAARPTDGPLVGRDAMVFLSLIEGDAIEVRVIVGSGDESRGDHFGVFSAEPAVGLSCRYRESRMLVLGIESSCDETAAAIIDELGCIRADVVFSQIKEHAPYGGVVPELASRAHMRTIADVVDRAVRQLPGGLSDLDAIAATAGPGLVGSLLVGLSFGKALAFSRDLPFVGVNHLTGHLLSPRLRSEPDEAIVDFPYVALLASGGHTALYLVRSASSIELLGQTRDDAAGEAYDKVGKLLGLGYPGGPRVDKLASEGDAHAFAFTVPMASRRETDFSFSGLKTAVAYEVAKHQGELTDELRRNVCASFQRVAVHSLVTKSVQACERVGVASLVLTGGVAANAGLRQYAEETCRARKIALHIPPRSRCTDNAAMIALAGLMRLTAGERDDLSLQLFHECKDSVAEKFVPTNSPTS